MSGILRVESTPFLGRFEVFSKSAGAWALWGHADYFRAASIESVRASHDIMGRYIRPSELERLFDFCSTDFRAQGARDAAIFAIFYCTGLRTSELVALDVRDYTPETGEIDVREGKFARPRRAFIRNEGKAALSAWINIRGVEPGPLFVAINRSSFIFRRRLSRQHVGRIVRRRAREAGIGKVRPHDLRRSFISNLLELGVDLLTVRKLAGHRSLHSTLLYDYRGRMAMQKAAARINIPYRVDAPKFRPATKKTIKLDAIRQASALSGLRIGRYSWQVLDALQKHRWITITIPNDFARSSLGSAVRSLPPGLMCMPRRSEGIVYLRAQNKQNEFRKCFAALEKYGLIECEDVNLEAGRRMPYAGYRITRLGRVTYKVACQAGLHGKLIELVRIRKKLAIALDKA